MYPGTGVSSRAAAYVWAVPTFDAIGVIATDMAETLAFYRLLGLDIADSADAEGHAEVEVQPGFRVMFDTVEVVESFSDYEAPTGGRGVAFAFRCDSPAEVDELFASVTARGYEAKTEPFDAFWGQRYATIVDPNGNPVDLYAALT